MRSKKILLFSFLLLIVLTVASLLVISSRRSAARARRFTTEAVATITEVNFTDYRTGRVSRERLDAIVDESAGKRRRTTRVKYRYTVDGRAVEGQVFPRGDQREEFAVGGQSKVCYDPRFPEESVLLETAAKCGEP